MKSGRLDHSTGHSGKGTAEPLLRIAVGFILIGVRAFALSVAVIVDVAPESDMRFSR